MTNEESVVPDDDGPDRVPIEPSPDSVSEPESDSERHSDRRRSDKSSSVVVVVAFVLIAMAINWPYQYVSVGSSGTVTSVVDFKAASHPLPKMGGWPYRYLVSYPDPQTSRFSALALLYDVALVIVAATLFLFYLSRRNRRFASGKTKGRLSIADLLLMTVLLALPFGWWQQLDARQETETALINEIKKRGGRVRTASWLPGIAGVFLPERVVTMLARIRGVRIEFPEAELVERLADHHELRVLRLGGGDYDLRLLDRLVANPHLHDLRLSGRVIDGEAIEWIATNGQVETLNLMRTNVSVAALQRLDALTGIRRLNLIHSDVVLSELGKPAWSNSIVELVLPHPDPGDEASLTLEGWPKLKKLTINELESQTNAVPMKVRLENLPSLEVLELDVFQKFDLTLRTLPKLASIQELDYEWRTRIPRGGVAPGQVWLSRFDAAGLPEFEKLMFFGVDLEHFLVRETPKFDHMGVGAFFRTVSANTYARKLTGETASAMIEGIGKSDGPRLLDLDAVPLAGVDLSPLTQNKRLDQIMLSQSETKLSQWKGLAPMTWLQRLDVKACPIDDKGIAWVLDSFPELEHFAFTATYEEEFGMQLGGGVSLELVDRPHLKTLDLGEFDSQFWNDVRIVNSPKVELDLRLGYIERLEVVDSPAIGGLSVAGPLPPDAKIRGVSGLEFFAVGGRGVDDNLLQAIVPCKRLRALTLAYPRVTAEGLKQLQSIQSLVSLSLPGAVVDDTVVAAWPVLDKLEYLDLRKTDVTGAGLKRLLQGGKVRHLMISDTKVAKEDLTALKDLDGLSSLMIGGIGVDVETLDSILQQGSLLRLDLSDSDVTAEMFDSILANAEKMQHLLLRNCEVDEKKLTMIAQRYPKLRYDLSGSTVSAALLGNLISSRRIVEADEWDRYVAMQAMMSSMQAGRNPTEPQRPSIIDVDFFADLPEGMGQSNPLIFSPSQPSVPWGVQIGRWLGGALRSGPKQDESEQDESEPEGADPSIDEIELPQESAADSVDDSVDESAEDTQGNPLP